MLMFYAMKCYINLELKIYRHVSYIRNEEKAVSLLYYLNIVLVVVIYSYFGDWNRKNSSLYHPEIISKVLSSIYTDVCVKISNL